MFDTEVDFNSLQRKFCKEIYCSIVDDFVNIEHSYSYSVASRPYTTGHPHPFLPHNLPLTSIIRIDRNKVRRYPI